jgi:hypothetical protein
VKNQDGGELFETASSWFIRAVSLRGAFAALMLFSPRSAGFHSSRGALFVLSKRASLKIGKRHQSRKKMTECSFTLKADIV